MRVRWQVRIGGKERVGDDLMMKEYRKVREVEVEVEVEVRGARGMWRARAWQEQSTRWRQARFELWLGVATHSLVPSHQNFADVARVLLESCEGHGLDRAICVRDFVSVRCRLACTWVCTLSSLLNNVPY